jgi:hypothetical protein
MESDNTVRGTGKLLSHLVAMADDAYFLGHPEWREILQDTRDVIASTQEDTEGPLQMPWPELQTLDAVLNPDPAAAEDPLPADWPAAMKEAEEKAIASLAGYKFMMFGYWAAIWVHLNRLSRAGRKSPFSLLVTLARKIQHS